MKNLILSISFLAFAFNSFSQSADCATMEPICTDAGVNFQATATGTEADVTNPGNDYDCLISQPDPTWYYLEIDNTGNLVMDLTAPSDIDYIVWGPFANLAAAQAGCGNLGNGGTGSNVVDCSFSATNMETPTINGAVSGEVYIMMVTNYAGTVQNISLTLNSGSSTGDTDCSIVNPCQITNLTTNISACDPVTGTFDLTGTIDFIDPPTTGTLTVTNCSGDQQTFNAPFGTSVNYSITGVTADGTAGCTVTATFSDDATCTQTSPTFTEPVCLCNLNSINANIGACDGLTNTYTVDGDVGFTTPPTTGTLTISVDDGVNPPQTQVFNAPFTSPTVFSIPNNPANGNAIAVTAVFSADPACTIAVNSTAQASCICSAQAGNYNASLTGISTNNYVLCYGDQIEITQTGGFTPPDNVFDPAITYDPGIQYIIYSCAPTPGIDPNTDPCLVGIYNTLVI